MNVPVVDFYSVLGIPKSATADDVRGAYKRKVLETHPDKLPLEASEEEKAEAQEQFSLVHEAFQTLGDTDQRRAYDIHYRDLPNPSTKLSSSPSVRSTYSARSTSSARTSDSSNTTRTYPPRAHTSDWKTVTEEHRRRLREREEWARKSEQRSEERVQALRTTTSQVQVRSNSTRSRRSDVTEVENKNKDTQMVPQGTRVAPHETRVVNRETRVVNHDLRMAMQEVQVSPEEYAAMVESMLQELYRLSPEWLERKERVRQLKAARALNATGTDNKSVTAPSS